VKSVSEHEAKTPTAPTNRPAPLTLNLDAADAYCRILTRRHYENFSVASRFVDPSRRRDLTRIYAFCRTTDDLGDESPDGTALERLERWRSEVEAFFGGIPAVHPVLVALAPTVERHAMPAQPFLDLIAANVQDQRVTHYRTWEELDGYCRLSAAPVGRMVLRVFDVDGARAERLSDDVCIGLQLANHAQDVSRDAAIGRRYLVDNDVEARGIAGAAQAMVERARTLLASGEELERSVPRPLRLQLALYRMGGLAICDAIQAIGYKTEGERPSVSASTKVSIVVRAALETFSRGRPAIDD
jgi:squalene synthase HpnC